MSGEAIDPYDTVKALGITLIITSIIYVLIIISCICTLGYKITTTSYAPLSRIYELMNHKLGIFSYLLGFLIMFNTAFLSLLTATRFMYSCSKNKTFVFSDLWVKLNDNQTPTNAILATFIISVLFACINNEVILSVFSNCAIFIVLILICLCILAIRWKERTDLKAQKKHNYIYGNINNMPILVIIELILLLILFGIIIKNKFYINDL